MSSRLILWDGRLPLPGDDTSPITEGEHGTRITGDRSRQASVSHLRHRHRRGHPIAQGQPGEAGRSGRQPGTDGNRDGGVCERALLGSMLARRRPPSASHQSSFRKALRQGIEERCGRRGGDLRSGDASNMRFVPVKSTDQQDLQSLHRARDRLICQRTALINHTRGLLAEYGVVLPQGPWRFMAQAPTAIAGADLSDLARAIFGELMGQLDDLDRRIQKLDAMIVTLCRTNETCRRLAKLPGVGPIIATAIVGSVNDGRQFRSGREMAAWIGLVPRQYTTGGKPRLGGIGRRANHYLRRQLIHGARAVVSRSAKHDDRQSIWLKALAARRGFNRTIVALANKTARIAWVLLSRKQEYAAP